MVQLQHCPLESEPISVQSVWCQSPQTPQSSARLQRRLCGALQPSLKLSSGQDMSKELRIRFRHPAGDVGPQEFPDHATVQQLKSTLHQSWPQGEQWAPAQHYH